MLKKLIIVLLLLSFTAKSQHIIDGTMNPVNDDVKWVALYQLKGSKQLFVKNVSPENGKFAIELPENSPAGMYRLRYKMDNQSLVDFIYNNESIQLNFDPNNPFETLAFSTSNENILYNSYLSKTNYVKQHLEGIQFNYFKLQSETEKLEAAKIYETTLVYYKEVQQEFEEKSKNLLAYHFIKASQKFYATTLFGSMQSYLNSEKMHFFDYVNFTDEVLNNSTFITELVLNYVFYLNISDDAEVQIKLYKSAINEVLTKMDQNLTLQSDVITTLLYAFSQNENIEIIDFIVDNFYNKLPEAYQNTEDVNPILEDLKLAVGRTAPNFNWEENGVSKNLYDLKNSNTYLLIFWSTGCSHCIIEVPELYTYLKNNPNITVLDIALENDAVEFEKYKLQFENWTNILGLGKWENAIAKNYEIISTPTYFILDANKKIIAKPGLIEEVKTYFKN
jgi:thiol-disulfide isomerase/thioredoxin